MFLVRAIQPPVQAQRVEAFAQLGHVRLLQAETLTDLRCIRQPHHLAAGKAALRQLQQAEKGLNHRMFIGLGDIGNIPRQGHAALGAAEHGLDIGRVAADLGDEHEDVFRLQAGIVLQTVQQGVVQRLTFAQRPVADVKLHRGQRCFRFPPQGLRRRVIVGGGVEDVGLQAAQQAVACRRQEVLAVAGQGNGVIEQPVLQGLPLAAPLREQGVAGLPQVDLVGVPAALPGHGARALQVGPVLVGGGQQPQMHFTVRGDGVEGLQQQRRQIVHREQVDARRQVFRLAGLQGGEKTPHQGDAMQLDIVTDPPPQPRLPAVALAP